jgi:hypothetical protein
MGRKPFARARGFDHVANFAEAKFGADPKTSDNLAWFSVCAPTG